MEKPTQYGDINELLDSLLISQQETLDEKLKGLYLYGSLVWGDFDHDHSDIDLLAVVSDEIGDEDYSALKVMHDAIAATHFVWEGRIEVQYATVTGLATFRKQASKMAVISPGEPFHVIEAGADWTTNWYFVQDYGVTLFGPSPAALIAPISKSEFIQAVRDHALFWREHVAQMKPYRGYQSYAVLTLCRALCTVTTGEQVSKRRAAEWAKPRMPEWANLIDEALEVRIGPADPKWGDPKDSYPRTERFVLHVIEEIEKAT